MKIYVEGWFHFKNEIGMNLMNSDKIEFHKRKNPEINYDWIINLSSIQDYNVGIDTGLIFGPQIMFPSIDTSMIPKNRKYTCNVLSKWMVDLCQDINPTVNFCALPFAVDINRFKPSQKIGKPVIYFKQRDPRILDDVTKELNIDFSIFKYFDLNSYSENEFQKSMSEAPYAIWIGRHESQGFAFQETLSSNTPIFVIDVRSKREEYPNSFWSNYLSGHKLPATSASYFDDRCGLICHPENWREYWDMFINNMGNYNPREFVLETLSPNACVEKWRNVLLDLKNN